MKGLSFNDMNYETKLQWLAVMIAVGNEKQRREALEYLRLIPAKAKGGGNDE